MCVGASCVSAHRRQRQAGLELHTEAPSQMEVEETTKGAGEMARPFGLGS